MNKLSLLFTGMALFLCQLLWAQQPGSEKSKPIRDERFRTLTRPQVLPQRLLQLQTTSVPDLVGREFNRELILPELEKLRLLLGNVVEEADNSRAGKIIQQEPAAGSRVFFGTRVNVVVAVQVPVQTVRKIAVPGVIGFNVFQAKQILSASRLKSGEVIEIPDNQPQQLVIRQFPAEGTFVDPGTPVNLYVSSGQALEQVYVPDLVGKRLEPAADILKRYNLRFGMLKEVFSEEPEGIIVSQSPEPGIPVDPGTPVDLVYTVNRRIPDLTGKPLDEALQLLRIVDLAVGKISGRKSESTPGTIIEQSLPAGSVITPGMVMDLFQSVGMPPGAIPPWIWWGAGILIITAGGGIIIRKTRKKGDESGSKADPDYKLKAVIDPGEQKIKDTEGQLPRIVFRIIPDNGTQTFEN